MLSGSSSAFAFIVLNLLEEKGFELSLCLALMTVRMSVLPGASDPVND